MPDWIRIAIALVVTSFLFVILFAMIFHSPQNDNDDWQPAFEKGFKIVGLAWIGGSVVIGFLFMWAWAVGTL